MDVSTAISLLPLCARAEPIEPVRRKCHLVPSVRKRSGVLFRGMRIVLDKVSLALVSIKSSSVSTIKGFSMATGGRTTATESESCGKAVSSISSADARQTSIITTVSAGRVSATISCSSTVLSGGKICGRTCLCPTSTTFSPLRHPTCLTIRLHARGTINTISTQIVPPSIIRLSIRLARDNCDEELCGAMPSMSAISLCEKPSTADRCNIFLYPSGRRLTSPSSSL